MCCFVFCYRPRCASVGGVFVEAGGLVGSFCAKKKRRKKRRVGCRLVVAGGQVSRMASASGQTYVRQALAPTLHSL